MDTATHTTVHRSPTLVAVASWLVPGMGYWMIGQKKRSLTVGLAVAGLFLLGLLIGGVRVLEVPGFGTRGEQIHARGSDRWIMAVSPWTEIRNKPWSIAQILSGPISIFSGAGSILSARPLEDGSGPLAIASHTPVSEAGTLYTSVAGMLNLLAIIDAAHRAAKREGAA